MKSTKSTSSTIQVTETSQSVAPLSQKSSDTALAIKVFLIAGSFIGAIWLLERLVSGG